LGLPHWAEYRTSTIPKAKKRCPCGLYGEILPEIKIAEENDDQTAQIQAMYDAIHQLSDVEKALIMMYLDDKPYREISEILGITEGNARVKMNRAKEKLKTLIKK
jgi:RNA polymerase sigma factor, sigma-70 family